MGQLNYFNDNGLLIAIKEDFITENLSEEFTNAINNSDTDTLLNLYNKEKTDEEKISVLTYFLIKKDLLNFKNVFEKDISNDDDLKNYCLAGLMNLETSFEIFSFIHDKFKNISGMGIYAAHLNPKNEDEQKIFSFLKENHKPYFEKNKTVLLEMAFKHKNQFIFDNISEFFNKEELSKLVFDGFIKNLRFGSDFYLKQKEYILGYKSTKIERENFAKSICIIINEEDIINILDFIFKAGIDEKIGLYDLDGVAFRMWNIMKKEKVLDFLIFEKDIANNELFKNIINNPKMRDAQLLISKVEKQKLYCSLKNNILTNQRREERKKI